MTLQLVEGEYYKTRDGRKIGPISPSTTIGWPWEVNDGEYDSSLGTRWAWREDGSFHQNSDRPAHDLDLIALWTEEPTTQEGPVRTETVTRTIIVPGVYGDLLVGSAENGTVKLRLHIDDIGRRYSAEQLEALIPLLTSLSKALREMKE